MPTLKGILGQAAPSADTNTDLYTIPANKNATVKVVAANRGSETVFRIWVALDAAATANAQYLAFDKTLAANDSLVTASFMAGGEDVVRVRAGSANVSFSVSGIEQDN